MISPVKENQTEARNQSKQLSTSTENSSGKEEELQRSCSVKPTFGFCSEIQAKIKGFGIGNREGFDDCIEITGHALFGDGAVIIIVGSNPVPDIEKPLFEQGSGGAMFGAVCGDRVWLQALKSV
ncbi:Chitin synthase, class 3 [Sarracenia purpurea var. burkii]